ncbi:hypothetical protein ElyMa_005305700 [Elysia marginata]|uniref:Uncharacterized protein n=1 Tax=Elysia marginata TaxID=1093978 RepID=A0AAV4K238_9GAST|nr:hypothetical protein ElyMa_005305700 [Elysia marginata]
MTVECRDLALELGRKSGSDKKKKKEKKELLKKKEKKITHPEYIRPREDNPTVLDEISGWDSGIYFPPYLLSPWISLVDVGDLRRMKGENPSHDGTAD